MDSQDPKMNDDNQEISEEASAPEAEESLAVSEDIQPESSASDAGEQDLNSETEEIPSTPEESADEAIPEPALMDAGEQDIDSETEEIPSAPEESADEAIPEPALMDAGEQESEEASEEVSEEGQEERALEPALMDADEDDSEDVPAASDGDDDEEDDEEESESAEDEPESTIKRGQLLEGTIKETSPTQVVVELTEDIDGVINSRELERLDRATLEELQTGSNIWVYVLRAPKGGGSALLSVNRAKEEQDWRLAEEYADSKNAIEGRVAGYNKGGLIIRFGRLRGFIPASQISYNREQRSKGASPDERWGSMLNEPIMVKVVEVNRARNRLILSERAAARESRERLKARLISNLSVGEVHKGKVISLTDFGAFVDIGGADGLIHVTELSWKHIEHARDLLSVGQEVEVKIISIDPERKRIGLSRKSLENDPWDEIQNNYKENQLVQGKITKLTRFGAFASMIDNPAIEGLIHVSELADYRVEHPRDIVAVGDVLTLRVVKIDGVRRRFGLSLKRVDSARYIDTDWNPE